MPNWRRIGVMEHRALRHDDHMSSCILRALNQGRRETASLAEWLAVDMLPLLQIVTSQLLPNQSRSLMKEARELGSLGITKRLEGIGRILHEVFADRSGRIELRKTIGSHVSDVVRQWAVYMVAADCRLELDARLRALRTFAADRNMSVRECAWMAFRPFLIPDLEAGISLLKPWTLDPDPYIRRFAIEVTRPRSVWGRHIVALKQNPSQGIVLLDPVRSDPSRYVQRAVANWLNDASKSTGSWVVDVCGRWTRDSPTPETGWIVRRALRTLTRENGTVTFVLPPRRVKDINSGRKGNRLHVLSEGAFTA